MSYVTQWDSKLTGLRAEYLSGRACYNGILWYHQWIQEEISNDSNIKSYDLVEGSAKKDN